MEQEHKITCRDCRNWFEHLDEEGNDNGEGYCEIHPPVWSKPFNSPVLNSDELDAGACNCLEVIY